MLVDNLGSGSFFCMSNVTYIIPSFSTACFLSCFIAENADSARDLCCATPSLPLSQMQQVSDLSTPNPRLNLVLNISRYSLVDTFFLLFSLLQTVYNLYIYLHSVVVTNIFDLCCYDVYNEIHQQGTWSCVQLHFFLFFTTSVRPICVLTSTTRHWCRKPRSY